ncbi:unnamed protein product [Calypogeia fissa]
MKTIIAIKFGNFFVTLRIPPVETSVIISTSAHTAASLYTWWVLG